MVLHGFEYPGPSFGAVKHQFHLRVNLFLRLYARRRDDVPRGAFQGGGQPLKEHVFGDDLGLLIGNVILSTSTNSIL